MKVKSRLTLLFLSLFAVLGLTNSTFALSLSELRMYGQNNILFYEPENCPSGTTAISPSSSETTSISSSNAEGAHNLSAEQVQFVEKYHDTAVLHSINYGIPWETVVAQGILESASGTSKIARDKNNFFGIGAYDTCPYECAFSYASIAEGWEGYYKNIVKTSVYRENGVFSSDTVTDPIAYLKAIKAAGYATDPNYISSVGSIISSIEKLSKDRGWQSSSELAEKYPEWKTNAENNRQGATGTNNSSSSITSSTLTNVFYDATKCKPNSASSSSASTENGVTYATYEGQTIAFPLLNATKENITGGHGTYTDLSNLPCNASIGCHYGENNPSGNAAAAFDICFKDDESCINGTVVSMTDGVITRFTQSRNGAYCNHVRIRSSIDNTVIAYMHLSGEEVNFTEGSEIHAGDIIGHISGNGPCHDNSTPHVHIDKGTSTSATGGPNESERDPKLTAMMNAAYYALPENAAELEQKNAQKSAENNSSTKNSASELISGGMTLEQAEKFMETYAKESDKFRTGTQTLSGGTIIDAGCPSGTLNNCSAFTQWFLNAHTTLGPSGANLVQGSQAVKQYTASGQLTYGGKVPKPYAVVSMGPMTGSADGWPNHTGIVLGINESTNEIIIGEASCGSGNGARYYRPHAKVYSLSEYTNNPSTYGPTYAYTDGVLKGEL